MKRYIDPFEYTPQILKALNKGVLLTGKAGDRVNSMTIGWGMLGIEWARPIFIAYVRDSRFTRELLEANGEFTVNIPMEGADVKNILAVCGTKSGRDMDKAAELELTLEEPEEISVPGIRELPLTLECKVIYRRDQDPQLVPPEIQAQCYSVEREGDTPFARGDYHTAYYGQIVASYIIED